MSSAQLVVVSEIWRLQTYF